MQSYTQNGRELEPFKSSFSYPEIDNVRPDIEDSSNFLAYCLKVKRPGELAPRGDFTPELLRPWIGYIMILDQVTERDDFRYRIYGSAIAEQTGYDMTRKLVSDFGGEPGKFFLKLYRDCLENRTIIYSIDSAPHIETSCIWHRVLCPVQRDDNIQIVVCSYPHLTDK